jgi:hypothetical protein
MENLTSGRSGEHVFRKWLIGDSRLDEYQDLMRGTRRPPGPMPERERAAGAA